MLGPPVQAGEWLAESGLSNTSTHRRGQVRIDGADAPFAQRYAIDWVRICDGRAWKSPGRANTDYCGYGSDVLAIADARVVTTKDGIPENKPGEASRSVPMTKDTLLGNYVILDLGAEAYALYAHLQPGSIQVKSDTVVRRGQVLGRIGNTGNSDAPHLHFHVVQKGSLEDVSVLQTSPIPYVFDRFERRGKYSGKGAVSDTLHDVRSLEMPLENDIVAFQP